MSKLDPRIEAVRAQYDLPADAFWQIPQNKQWVCKHAALEIVATKADVKWEPPQIIQADTGNGIAVLSVAGRLGDRLEWATGEASPKNNKNSYPWAMAEKRAKDRVILKLVGIHGLVYSEDEMPADMDNAPKGPSKNADARDTYSTLENDMRANKSKADLKRWISDPDVKALRAKLPADWDKNLKQAAADYGRDLPEGDDPTVNAVKNAFPGARVVDERNEYLENMSAG